MSLDLEMEEFREIFFEECLENLEILEQGMLGMDKDSDAETINTIFRAAHSIKGGSGTFGFAGIADFTHVMENILGAIRDGTMVAEQTTVDLLLQAADFLRVLVEAAQAGEEADPETQSSLKKRLEECLENGGVPEGNPGAGQVVSSDIANVVEEGSGTWYIKITPKTAHKAETEKLLALFEALHAYDGTSCSLDASKVPSIKEIDPEKNYLVWEFTLCEPLSQEELVAILAPVDDFCDVQFDALQEVALSSPEPEPKQDMPAEQNAADAAPAAAAKPPAKPASGKGTGKKTESSSIRVNIEKIDELINLVGELVITQSMLSQNGREMGMAISDKMRQGLEQLERNCRELQEGVMQIRMLPISFAFNRFPRLIRDLSRSLGKKVELQLAGEHTELDKTVMEYISDPLVHLLRNALDHGIESPEVRTANGKPDTGTINLEASHQGGSVVIEVRDDGGGINCAKLLAKAQERGLVREDENLSEDKIVDLIFHPGFSTAEVVNDVSGRGVGMDVVRKNIRDLGGSIEVTSVEGKGTNFCIRLPLTLAIIDGQLVRVGDEVYIVPLLSIVETLQFESERINTVTGKSPVYLFRDDYVPVIDLHQLFDTAPASAGETQEDEHEGLLVIVENIGQHIGLYVDELLGQQQVVIKSLETNFYSVEGVSGATILGDGTVALILDIPGVMKLAKASGVAAGMSLVTGDQDLVA